MADLQQIVDDLRAESDELDALVAPLAEDRWTASTPAEGWTIAHQIGRLLWTDRVALLAVTDEAAFADTLILRRPTRAASSTPRPMNSPPSRQPSCSPTGGSPARGCTTRCRRFPTVGNCRGSGRR